MPPDFSRTRQEEVHTRGAAIDDSLAPQDHDANAVDLAGTLDHVCSQFVKLTGENAWEDPPAATIKALADAAVGVLPPATDLGQVLFSVDGKTFEPRLPVTTDEGWLVNDEGHLLVAGG